MIGKNRFIKILHIVTGIGYGGVGVFLLNYYKHIDRKAIHFDIIAIDVGHEQDYAESFKALGANVYYMPKSYTKRFFFLAKHLFSHKYDIVHSHIELASAIYLLMARIFGNKIRIAHAHMAYLNYNSLKSRVLHKLLNNTSTHKWGCSVDALRGLFGEEYAVHDNVIYNAMEVDEFIFNSVVRNKYRKELDLMDKFVLGFVGRLTYQKNIFYLVEIFREVKQIIPNAVFIVCGDGILRSDMYGVIKKYGIEDSVLMLGNRADVNCLMQAMDVFVLPSRWEGLGIVLIEAQAASLRCVAAKGTIPMSTKVTDYIDYISIDVPAREWATHIKEQCMGYPRKNMRKEIVSAHYDIAEEAKRLEQMYFSLVKYRSAYESLGHR